MYAGILLTPRFRADCEWSFRSDESRLCVDLSRVERLTVGLIISGYECLHQTVSFNQIGSIRDLRPENDLQKVVSEDKRQGRFTEDLQINSVWRSKLNKVNQPMEHDTSLWQRYCLGFQSGCRNPFVVRFYDISNGINHLPRTQWHCRMLFQLGL